MQAKEYVIRKQGNAYTYGLGEVISEGVALYKDGHYNLTQEELEIAIKKLGRATILNEQP